MSLSVNEFAETRFHWFLDFCVPSSYKTTPLTSSEGWSTGLPVASPTLPRDGKWVPLTNTRWGGETRAELKSCITEHTPHPCRTRNHWCLPPSSAPAQTLTHSSGATATSSVEDLNRSYRAPHNLCQAALLNPRAASHPAPPQDLSPWPPDPCLSSPQRIPLQRSSRSASRQPITAWRALAYLRNHVPKEPQPITTEHLFVAPPPAEGREIGVREPVQSGKSARSRRSGLL